jgi:hypothetical protein
MFQLSHFMPDIICKSRTVETFASHVMVFVECNLDLSEKRGTYSQK